MVLDEVIGELLIGRLRERHLLPEVRREIGVGLGDRRVRGLGEVAQRARRTPRRGVAVLDAGHLQQLLRDGSGHDAGAAGGRYQPHGDRAALAGYLRNTDRV